VGASGSGKSSLVRGLVPAIRWDKECADWQICHVIALTAHLVRPGG
jgi:hypothetical protein